MDRYVVGFVCVSLYLARCIYVQLFFFLSELPNVNVVCTGNVQSYETFPSVCLHTKLIRTKKYIDQRWLQSRFWQKIITYAYFVFKLRRDESIRMVPDKLLYKHGRKLILLDHITQNSQLLILSYYLPSNTSSYLPLSPEQQ